jgi:hypothetical protein
VEDVRARLHSTNPADVAWAAFDAATFQMREVAPDLIAVLDTPPEVEERIRYPLISAVLDALIQLRGTGRFPAGVTGPAPAILDRYHARWPVQTLILLSAPVSTRVSLPVPGRGETLERWLRSATSGLDWYAAANELLKESAPPRGFAADLLNGIKLTLEISVSDDGTSGGIGSGALGRSVGVADGIGETPRGFPPHAVYDFELRRTPGSILLSTGPQDAFYSRRVTNDFQFGVATVFEGWPSVDIRLDCVNALGARRYRFYLKERTSVNLKWRNEQTLRADIAREQKKISDEYERMLQALMNAGDLTAEEANTMPLALNTQIDDVRTDRKRPLQ